MNKINVVYKIKNIVNNRFYIGSTINYKSRKCEHLRLLKKNIHENEFLQNDFNKCGKDAFVFEIIEEYYNLDIKILLNREQYYLNKFFDNKQNCYNINPIASKPPIKNQFGSKNHMYGKIGLLNPSYGRCSSEETKNKISISKFGIKISENTKEKLSKIRKEFHLKNPNHFKGEKAPMFGKTHSKETKEKMSKSQKGKNNKPIKSINIETGEIKKFESLTSASKYYKLSLTAILLNLNGKTFACKNQTIKFERIKK